MDFQPFLLVKLQTSLRQHRPTGHGQALRKSQKGQANRDGFEHQPNWIREETARPRKSRRPLNPPAGSPRD
jgi:hypothetical protein